MHAYPWCSSNRHLICISHDQIDCLKLLRRTLARKLRDEARLHERTGSGQRRLLRLLSGPRAIWRACSALGCYFSVLIFLMGVSAVLSLVSIYPVVAASQQSSNTSDSYRCESLLFMKLNVVHVCTRKRKRTSHVQLPDAASQWRKHHDTSLISIPHTAKRRTLYSL
jgi:hypothetical protein